MPKVQFISDKLAMLLSSLCVIHCLLTPILLISIPALAGVSILNDETFHQILLFFVLPIGVFALSLGYLHHKNKWVVFAGVFGLTLLSSPLLVEWIGLGHEVLGEYGEVTITVIASFIIVGAHLINYRLRSTVQVPICEERETTQSQPY
ncbi:MAG: MerC domain-containing protein [Pseudomonadota bacterium]|nr:MerC domain-containing protein [Alteromonas macleodii]MED5425675.1 MerC domain-containing protein [Pseudomonadota bacterium]CAI3969099.1 MerC mercury resistance protein [Alteromonas macleodii]VTP56226.1 MerC mercury resistance protein [Alteromonas macleodii]